MIIGTGIDIVDVERIRLSLAQYGAQFIQRIFTEDEIKYCSQKPIRQQPVHYAARFAAKEAFSKAIGSGIGETIAFKDISITNDKRGKPCVKILNPNAVIYLENAVVHCSLSHSHLYAVASIIIEKLSLS